MNSTLNGVHHIPGPYINTYNSQQKTGKDRKDINRSVTLARPVFLYFSVFDFELEQMLFDIGYWLHLGDFHFN